MAAKVKEFTGGKGVNVWYETQREPDYDRIVDADGAARPDRRHGRPAGPADVPGRAVLRQGPVAVRLRHVQLPPAEQRRCAEDINRWLAERKLKPNIGRRMKLSEAAAAHRLQEENTLKGAGTLTGKIVLMP